MNNFKKPEEKKIAAPTVSTAAENKPAPAKTAVKSAAAESKTETKSAAPAAPKAAAKTAAKKTAPKSAAKKTAVKAEKPAVKKAAKTASKTAAKSSAKTKSTAKTAAKSTAKSAAKTAAKPAAKKAAAAKKVTRKAKAVTIEDICEKLEKKISKSKVSAIKEKIAVDIEVWGFEDGSNHKMYIEINNGKAVVSPHTYEAKDFRVSLSFANAVAFVNGKLTLKALTASNDFYAEGRIVPAVMLASIF